MNKRMIGCFAALVTARSSEAYITGLAAVGGATASRITAPDSSKVNAPVVVTVSATGSISEGCNRPAGFKVQEAGSVSRIEIFHRYPRGDVTCPAAPKEYYETVTLRFPTPGVKTIRLIGVSSWRGEGSPLDSVQRTITITP